MATADNKVAWMTLEDVGQVMKATLHGGRIEPSLQLIGISSCSRK